MWHEIADKWRVRLAGAALATGCAATAAYHHFVVDGIDALLWPIQWTEYATGYSHWRFSYLRVGMTAAEVEYLIGSPLANDKLDDGTLRWAYSRRVGDLSYRERFVFLVDGKVVRIVKDFYVD